MLVGLIRPFRALRWCIDSVPRAMPWALVGRPVGAGVCFAVDFRMGVLLLLLEPMGSRDGPERGACWVEYEYRPAG